MKNFPCVWAHRPISPSKRPETCPKWDVTHRKRK